MTNTLNSEWGAYSSDSASWNSYSAIYNLHSMVEPKLKGESAKVYAENKKQFIAYSQWVYTDEIPFRIIGKWFNLLMRCINDSDLLPAERTSYSTGGEE